MDTTFLERHAQELQREARETAERSAAAPDDFWLKAAADNQRQAADDALGKLELAHARRTRPVTTDCSPD